MIRIWIHVVIYSKYSFASIDGSELYRVKDFILKSALEKDIVVMSVNGTGNHLHFLLNMGGHQRVDDVVSYLKEISKHHIKEYLVSNFAFEWEADFFAFSISSSLLELERYCIDTQGMYHLSKDLGSEMAMHINECQVDYQNI